LEPGEKKSAEREYSKPARTARQLSYRQAISQASSICLGNFSATLVSWQLKK
jgi:hypothetical protein